MFPHNVYISYDACDLDSATFNSTIDTVVVDVMLLYTQLFGNKTLALVDFEQATRGRGAGGSWRKTR
jgi:hypothetical protein